MKRILVVDDEKDIRSFMIIALQEKGYETMEADNGADAFELARTDTPDLIISDVVMNRVNGFLFHELLQEDIRTSMIPLILISGLALQESDWKSNPYITYLEKPFSMPELLAAVQQKLQPG